MEVIGKSLHSETLEKFVTYRHISGKRKEEKYFWVRPIGMFLENVEVDGKIIPRFKFVSTKEKDGKENS